MPRTRLTCAAALLALAAAGCAEARESWPSIESAPPIAFDAGLPPPEDRPKSEAEFYARDQGVTLAEAARRLRLQEEVAPETGRLRELLSVRERGNFADLWIEHQPEWRVVVGFKRDPAATLARYTSNPHFVARQVASSSEELETVRQRVHRQLQALGWSYGIGTDVRAGVISVDLWEDAEKLAAATAAGKLDLSGPVRVTTPPALVPADPVAPEAERFVRIFPQAASRTGAETAELNIGTIVLRDGCLRLDRDEGPDPLAFFGRESALKLDEGGALTLYNRATGAAGHVGERMALGGGAGRPVTDAAALRQIAAACGPGPVVWVGNPHSYAASRMASAGWRIDERAAREGVSRAEALKRMQAEWAAEDAAYERARAAANR